ncbi:hypothetical protein HBI23_165510 [Parastagonospora nodorum]|nr:hypothetical protein HBI23_165510 [Parastagonospora nodorum]
MLAKQKLEENYFKHELLKLKYILLISICNRPSLKYYKTKAADSRHAKVSRRRTKKDKDLENSNTSSDKRLKALLNAKIRDSLSIRVEIAIEYYTLEE